MRYARGVSSDAALGAAVAAVYPIAPVRGCAWIERVASRLARIETADRVCWLKLGGYGRGIDELEAEAEVAAALAGRGLAVAAPVARRDGRYAGAIALSDGLRLALLFDEAPGDEVAGPSVAQAEALGALLARVHAAVRHSRRSGRRAGHDHRTFAGCRRTARRPVPWRRAAR